MFNSRRLWNMALLTLMILTGAGGAQADAPQELIAFTAVKVVHSFDEDQQCPGNIILATPEGAVIREIETGCYDPAGLEWSADGEWLGQSLMDHLALINAHTYGVRVLELDHLELTASHMTFSPDGSQIALRAFITEDLAAGGGVKWSELYVMDAHGRNQHRIAESISISGHPLWTPDGKQLVFAGVPMDAEGNMTGNNTDLYRINADGTGLEPVTTMPSNEDHPLLSPDGSQMIWMSLTFQSHLWTPYLHDLNTGTTRPLTAQGDAGVPISGWSPEGNRLILYRGTPEGAELWLLDLPTGLRQFLIRAPTFGGGVDWSPDGTRIVYAKGRTPASKYADICMMELTSLMENCPGLKGHWLSEPMWR